MRDDTIGRAAGADELEVMLDGTPDALVHYLSTRLLLAGLGGLRPPPSDDDDVAAAAYSATAAPPSSTSPAAPSLLARTLAATRAHTAASSAAAVAAAAVAVGEAQAAPRVDIVAIAALHASRKLLVAWEELARGRAQAQ